MTTYYWFAIWILLFILTVSTVASETNSTLTANITTLYPVFNKTITRNEFYTRFSDTITKPSDIKARINETETRLNDTEARLNNTETTVNKTEAKSKPATQSWKIETGFAPSNLTEDENNTTDAKVRQEKKERLKDFKPSQHLGSFFDDDSAEVIKTPVFGPVEKKPASGFISSIKDDYPRHPSYNKDEYPHHSTFNKPEYPHHSTFNKPEYPHHSTFNEPEYPHHSAFNKIPKEIYYTHQEFPYKFEDTIYTKTKGGWTDSMESKPTVEVPVKVPAGGLYQSPDAFKENPHGDEEFGLEYYEDGKEHAVKNKKRGNPWKDLLRLVTAFIPVGLIISALTPSIVTIHNVDGNQPPSSLPYRRSDPGMSDVAPISERCRRRLLCELHSERNYVPPSTLPRRTMKHCYKIHCEDSEALWRILRWLFNYNQGEHADGDQRGRLLT